MSHSVVFFDATNNDLGYHYPIFVDLFLLYVRGYHFDMPQIRWSTALD